MPEMIYISEYDNLMTITKKEFSNSDFLDYNWLLIMDIIDEKYNDYLSGERDIEEMSDKEFEKFKEQIIQYLDEVDEEINKPTQ